MLPLLNHKLRKQLDIIHLHACFAVVLQFHAGAHLNIHV